MTYNTSKCVRFCVYMCICNLNIFCSIFSSLGTEWGHVSSSNRASKYSLSFMYSNDLAVLFVQNQSFRSIDSMRKYYSGLNSIFQSAVVTLKMSSSSLKSDQLLFFHNNEYMQVWLKSTHWF